MDFFETVARRHSYREPLSARAVPRNHLKKIVQAGLDAPSGRNAQTTRFVIVDDDDLVREIKEMHATNQAMRTAPAYILCAVDRKPEAVYEGLAFQVEDCAAAVENMLLAAAALGYVSVWVDGWLRTDGRAERIGRLVGLPTGKTVRVILPIGFPTVEGRRPEKLPFEERAFFNRYPEPEA